MIVKSRSKCELRCYQEAECVSYNFGPIPSDTPSCDLNNSTHLQVPSSDFVSKDGYIYRHILVRDKKKVDSFCFNLSTQSRLCLFWFCINTLCDAQLTRTTFPRAPRVLHVFAWKFYIQVR